jgi:hypothetical protein
MDELEPIEKLLRDELLDGDDLLVVRGWPLTVDGARRRRLCAAPNLPRPHYSVTLEPYTPERAGRLLEVLGDVVANPYYLRRAQ